MPGALLDLEEVSLAGVLNPNLKINFTSAVETRFIRITVSELSPANQESPLVIRGYVRVLPRLNISVAH